MCPIRFETRYTYLGSIETRGGGIRSPVRLRSQLWSEPNVLAYVRSNPLRSSDPLGLYTVDRSCYTCGPPNFGKVGAEVTRMCTQTQRPAASRLQKVLELVPAANRGKAEPLDSCCLVDVQVLRSQYLCCQHSASRRPTVRSLRAGGIAE